MAICPAPDIPAIDGADDGAGGEHVGAEEDCVATRAIRSRIWSKACTPSAKLPVPSIGVDQVAASAPCLAQAAAEALDALRAALDGMAAIGDAAETALAEMLAHQAAGIIAG